MSPCRLVTEVGLDGNSQSGWMIWMMINDNDAAPLAIINSVDSHAIGCNLTSSPTTVRSPHSHICAPLFKHVCAT